VEIKIASSSFNWPNQAGNEEYFTLDLSNQTQEVFSVKLRAIDSSNNSAPWSNLITVKLTPNDIQLSPQLRLYKPPPISSLKNENHSNEASPQHLDDKQLIQQKVKLYSNFFIALLGKSHHNTMS
jgi:hypothetical protein